MNMEPHYLFVLRDKIFIQQQQNCRLNNNYFDVELGI